MNGRLRKDLTVTCCVVSLDTVDGTAEVALAGHPPPLVGGPDGKIGVLEAPANVPLGVCPAGAYQGREHTLESGALLILYTNGLVGWDTADAEARSRALLGSGDQGSPLDLEQLADAVISEVSAPWQRRDDAVLLLALYEGTRDQDEPRVGRLHIQRHDLRGVREARTFVHDRLASWGLDAMSDAMELVVSEIVTNALVHAGSDVDVRLRAFADHIRLEVRDSDTNPPVPSRMSLTEETNAEAEHGRGLLIVEALAEMWNSSPNGLGKTVSLNMPITLDRIGRRGTGQTPFHPSSLPTRDGGVTSATSAKERRTGRTRSECRGPFRSRTSAEPKLSTTFRVSNGGVLKGVTTRLPPPLGPFRGIPMRVRCRGVRVPLPTLSPGSRRRSRHDGTGKTDVAQPWKTVCRLGTLHGLSPPGVDV
ncbi:ATP-binding SpoIIE family protein phosphatase [Streptomyces sp. NPDC052109]|uniref:ATP-binding SpoIIE family protein phosphatase n=1 Tax=Streptomyces sp. NPDC052109 TaxID=3155527 RepID=UPI003441D80B